jgi:hypothetical protein
MDITDLIMSLGIFNRYKFKKTQGGSVDEYRYYPSYLGDNHYTLIIFKSNKVVDGNFNTIDYSGKNFSGNEYRLYIHKNSDGSYVDSPFQISDYNDMTNNLLVKEIMTIFKHEFRILKIKKLTQ